MTGMTWRRARAVLAVIAAVSCSGAAALAIAAPASAAPSGIELDVGNTGTYTSTPNTPLLNVNNMVPGSTVSGQLGVWNTTGNPASITLQFVNPVAIPSGPGHLDAELHFALATAPVGAVPTYTQIWTGSAADLDTGVQVLAALAANSKELVRLSATLPLAVGNSAQGNSFTFGIAVTLTGPDLGGPIIPAPLSSPPVSSPAPSSTAPSSGSTSTSASAEVSGVITQKHQPSGGSTATIPPAQGEHQSSGTGALATTGIDIALLSLIGILLILCGVLITMRWRGAREH